jgi:hypothetical protein
MSSDSILSPAARASTIEPIMVASAPVAVWRASFGDFLGTAERHFHLTIFPRMGEAQ